MLENYDDVLSLDEVKEILKIGDSTAYKLVSKGIIKSFKCGRIWKVSKRAVIDYIEHQQNNMIDKVG